MAARKAASANSVSARVTRSTGQTPPMSARAISSAASALPRRRARIAWSSLSAVSPARSTSAISAANCASGSDSSTARKRSGSWRMRSHKYGEPSANPRDQLGELGVASLGRNEQLPDRLAGTAARNFSQPFGDPRVRFIRRGQFGRGLDLTASDGAGSPFLAAHFADSAIRFTPASIGARR